MPALTHHRTMSSPLPVKLLALLFIGGLGSVVMAGCVGPVHYTRTINETAERYVKLEAHYGSGQLGTGVRFSHPLELNERDWSLLLNGVYVQPRSKGLFHTSRAPTTPSPAFNDDDRRYLARYLAEAFAQARPDQWGVFFLSQPREPRVTEITSGGFFVEGGHLHLVLANYRQPVSMAYVQEQIKGAPLRPAGDSYYDFLPQKHQTIRVDGHWALTKPLVVPVSELVIDYRAALLLPRDAASPDGPQVSESVGGRGEGSPLADRLRTLQQLREQGLITEEEYRMKRQKLLDDL